MADTDIRLGISAVDLGAARLVRGVADALRALNSVQAQQARTTAQSAAASRQAASGLETQARIARAAVIDEQNRLRRIQETSRARIEAIRRERDETINAARVMARANEEAARGMRRMAQENLRVARQPITGTVDGRTITTGPNPELIAARRRELAVENENVARARALGRQLIAQARQVGQAEEAAARQQVRAQQSIVIARRQAAAESLRAARQAERNARAEERAAQRAAAAYQRQAAIMGTISRRTDDIRNRILRLAAAYSGFRALEGFIGAGLRFNQILESSRLGIGALITAEAQLFTQQGELLTGTQALSAAQGLAEDQLNKLRIAGIQTAATTEDLVTAFEEAVGAGLAVGLTLDQIRRFSVSVAQAASAIHLPMNQLQQETRSILQGTIDRNSRIAKALQLTNEQVRLAKEQGRLAEFLEERFKAFNVAGAESVKTFGALRSNIADAFSVFAGLATRPLFEQMRDAGVKALSEIFDFRSADIATSFRGLVEGLQILFKEIGGLLADAIENAVERAQELSKWFQANRQEVKETAQAIRTMVESFGRMISSVVSAVTMFGTLRGSLNPIEATARLLDALFRNIADTIKLIVGLLTARALITALTGIVAVFSALRSGAAGAVIGLGTTGNPLGAAIGGTIGLILGLGTAVKLFKGEQKSAALETARMTTALQDQTQQAAELFGTIESLTRQLGAKGLGDDERAQLLDQRKAALEQLGALEGEYGKIIDNQNLTLEEKRKKILELLETQRAQAEFQATNATIELENLRRQAQAARAAVPTGAAAVFGSGRAKAAAEEAETELAAMEERAKTLRAAYLKLQATITEALRTPARIKFSGVKTDEDQNKDVNDAVQRAQAQLEITRANNEARLNLIQAQFKNGLKTQIDVINAEKDAALAEMAAEEKLLEAKRDAAARRVVKGKVSPDQGAIDALNAQITALQNRRVLLEAETNEKLESERRAHAEANAKIEEDFLRVTGNRLAAIRLEIERKHHQELQDAIRRFGPESEQVVHIRFVINQESIREQAEAIEDEIRRIEEQAKREVATARLKILGANAERGSGNAEQRQQLADAISAAYDKATKSSEELLKTLVLLKAASADDNTRTFIQSLIDQIEQLRTRGEEVDDQMRRLKEGVTEAFVSGISGFLDNLTDKTKTFGQSFRDMVTGILSDISRLVSRLLAEKIVFSLLGVGAAEGGQAGNLTQSQGRAAGGLARPPHGLLKGGIPGTDSIHIAAMPNEYFTRTAAVQHYGVELFDALNNMELPRVNPRSFKPMAIGGAAGDGSPSVARPSARQQVDHVLHFDQDGLVRVMKGRFGRDITLRHVQGNPRTVSSALRGRRA